MSEPSAESGRPPGGTQPPAPPGTADPGSGPNPRDPGPPITVHVGGVLIGDLGAQTVDALLLNAILLRDATVGRWLEDRGVRSVDVEAAFRPRPGHSPTASECNSTHKPQSGPGRRSLDRAVLVCAIRDTPNVRFEDPSPDRAGLDSTDPFTVSSALVGLALYHSDRAELEVVCRRLAAHADQGVRDTAGLCMGHVARRFGEIEDATYAVLLTLVEAPTSDGRPTDGLDDVHQFTDR